METYIAGKNELLNSLADPKIFNYINKVFKDISNDPKSPKLESDATSYLKS